MVDQSSSSRGDLVGVATNVITGFLGAGKSTAILHLLRAKPADERWAILVNEFGEVGIDGSLLAGEGEEQGIYLREVPGGCMCCTAGLPMQIALGVLLAHGRPHRLLIEPTGLGHPQEVLDTLTAEHYRDVLDLRATITLVDARKIQDPRYTEHSTFVQQLAVADVIVANKIDRYDDDDLPALRNYLDATEGLGGKPLVQVEHGALELEWLRAPAGHGASRHGHGHDHDHDHGHGHDHDRDHVQDHDGADARIPLVPEIPDEGFVRIDNEGEGYFSQGWIFDPSWTFDEDRLSSFLSGVVAARLKGVFLTDRGASAFNMVDDVLTKSVLPESADSRVEIISASRSAFTGVEQALLDCVISR